MQSAIRGFRPPRFLTLFEALVNGIGCQQLSLTVGIILLNRLVERYGYKLGDRYAFPEANDLSSLERRICCRLVTAKTKRVP